MNSYSMAGQLNINFEPVVRALENVLGIKGIVVIGEKFGKVEIIYKYQLPSVALESIRRCIHKSDTLGQAILCVERDIEFHCPPDLFVVPLCIELSSNEKTYVFVARRFKSFGNYEMLLIRELIQSLMLTQKLNEFASSLHVLQSFVDFLEHAVAISFPNVSLEKLAYLWAVELLGFFKLSGSIVSFRFAEGSISAETGHIPLNLKIIRSVTLKTSGLVKGGGNDSYWVVSSFIEPETSTQVTLFRTSEFLPQELKLLPVAVAVAHNSLKNTLHFHREVQQIRELKTLNYEIILTLEDMIEARDPITRGHSERVAEFAVRMGKALNFDKEHLEKLRLAALLHDIGKIGIPDSVLLKPGPLTPDELEILHQHVVISSRIVEKITGFKEIAPWVAHHHERWDGKGYPDGLVGMQIPFEARILAIADSIEAMLSDRVYRRALPWSKVREILKEGAGKQWDPELVKVALSVFKEEPPLKGLRKEIDFVGKEVMEIRLKSSLAYWQMSLLNVLKEILRKDKRSDEKLAEILTLLYENSGVELVGVVGFDGDHLRPLALLTEFDVDKEFLKRLKIPKNRYRDFIFSEIEKRYPSLTWNLIKPIKLGDRDKGLLIIGASESESPLLQDEDFLESFAKQLAPLLPDIPPSNNLPIVIDPSTGLFNLHSLEPKLADMQRITIGCIQFDGIEKIVDIYGKSLANCLKREILKLIRKYLHESAMMAHFQADKVLVLCNCEARTLRQILSKFRTEYVGKSIKIGPEYLEIPELNFEILGTVNKLKDLWKLLRNFFG